MRRPTTPRAAPALLLAAFATSAAAQATLGELLDAGAVRLTPNEFRGQVVQHALAGPAPTGGHLEIMYADNGMVQGLSTTPSAPILHSVSSPLRGDWKFDDSERVCTALQITATSGTVVVLPSRCQFWFRLEDAYYVSDSDSDRRAKVLRRTVKK